MTKNSVLVLCDKLFWFLVMLLPLVSFLIILWHSPESATISSAFSAIGLSIVSDNLILTTFESIFGATGIFPIFVSNDFLILLTYFSMVVILHFVLDVFLIIIRWAHNLLDKAQKE